MAMAKWFGWGVVSLRGEALTGGEGTGDGETGIAFCSVLRYHLFLTNLPLAGLRKYSQAGGQAPEATGAHHLRRKLHTSPRTDFSEILHASIDNAKKYPVTWRAHELYLCDTNSDSIRPQWRRATTGEERVMPPKANVSD